MTIDEAARTFTELSSSDADRFDRLAGTILSYQTAHNPVYGRYCKAIASRIGSLPAFLPIAAFKEAAVATCSAEDADGVFESSGTGRGRRSRHYVKDLSVYERSATRHFETVFGTGPYHFAMHLPGYQEMGESSSLLYMVELLGSRYGLEGPVSVLRDSARLERMAVQSASDGVPLLLFGAAFGLLDLLDERSFELPSGSIVVETGGMKTYRREVPREELHDRLSAGFGISRHAVYSEYGMCELLSQCYTRGDGVFVAPPWVRTWIVDPDEPFDPLPEGRVGALAVLDLANVYSASAILTEDKAVQRGVGFEVLGRLRGAELRGCNFLMEHV